MRYRNRRRRTILLGVLALVGFMSIGYALLATNLELLVQVISLVILMYILKVLRLRHCITQTRLKLLSEAIN